mmetsp:Transcript_25869/g.65216  ORF Transcript_25869/g.65216 Transcript_25869/m.65216 type:complete len:343 (-) Transcript_25869:182-1210(-)
MVGAGRSSGCAPASLYAQLLVLLLLGPICKAQQESPHRLANPAPPLVYYNRVPKAGSSTVLGLIASLQKQNGFTHVHKLQDFYWDRPGPAANEQAVAELFNTARAAGEPAAYDCHTYFIDFFGSPAVRARLGGDVSDVHFINVLRNPSQRMRSLFYYAVDPVARGGERAEQIQRRRRADPCGCGDISYNECIEQAHTTNCSAGTNIATRGRSAVRHFLTAEDSAAYHKTECTVEARAPLVLKAMANMQLYTVIGLAERMDDTVKLLEARLPAVFRGASHRLAMRGRDRVTTVPFKFSTQGPLVSSKADAILRANPCNMGEYAIWEHAKRLFHNATGVDVRGL